MSAAAIDRIREAGFDLRAEGDRLTVTGPRPLSDEQRRFVKDNKAELLIAVKLRQATDHPTTKAALDLWPGAEIVDIRDAREERAAIIHEAHTRIWDDGGKKLLPEPEYDLPVEAAEALGDHELLNHPHKPDDWA